jgi:hypothetical protein
VDWSATNPEKASIMHNFIFNSFKRFTSQLLFDRLKLISWN